MRALARFAAAVRGYFRPESLDAEVSEELRFHLERQIEMNRRAGMSPEEAQRAAHLAVGSVETIREESRGARPGALMHQVVRDLVFGVRLLRRAPGLAIISALVVALGIGTTTAIFSVVYGVMLRPLPYPEPDRLVALWSRLPNSSQRVRANPADHREWLVSNTVFEDIALATAPQNFNLIGSGEPERVVAGRLSSNLLPVLRVSPALGRGFTQDETRIGNEQVVILGEGLWRRRFGADPTIVGRTINLSGAPYEVVGVLRSDFQFPAREHQLWIPLTINPRQLTREVDGHEHLAVARLKPGIGIEQAQREMDTIAARLEAEYPKTNRGVRVEVLPLREESVRGLRPTLYVMLAAVLSLLLIACLNLAGLLGTRAASRAREFTVRLALGASRGRLTLQALAEVTPVLIIGGLAGVAGAWFAIAAFVPIAPAALPRVDTLQINGAVLAFSIAMLVLTGIVGGLLPALHAWRANAPIVATGGRSGTATRADVRTRNALVVAQLALTLPLLVGATALVRTFSALMDVDPGFRTDNVLSMHMAIPRTKYSSDEQIAAFYNRLVERIEAIPGVISAGMVNRLPLSGNNQSAAVTFENVNGEPIALQSRSVTPDYFRAMSIPLREGRTVTERDTASAPLVGIVDDRLARTLWPGQSALEKRFKVALPGQQVLTEGRIVGVVGNIRHGGLDSDGDRQLYLSYHQFTDGRIVLVVRGRADVRALTPAVLQAIQALDPEQPVYDVRTMEDVIARSTAERWLNMTIVMVFAMSSLALAGVGLYGVIAHGVAQRIREFGVRLALGATRSDVSRLVLRKGSILAVYGAALGLGGAVALALGMKSLLYGVPPLDPVTFAAAGALMFAVALVASYLPARRAARTDPAHALRAER
jgi:putative ABC transport system permease protein